MSVLQGLRSFLDYFLVECLEEAELLAIPRLARLHLTYLVLATRPLLRCNGIDGLVTADAAILMRRLHTSLCYDYRRCLRMQFPM